MDDFNPRRKDAFSFSSPEHTLVSLLCATANFKLAPTTREIHKDYEFLMFQQQYVLEKNVVVE